MFNPQGFPFTVPVALYGFSSGANVSPAGTQASDILTQKVVSFARTSGIVTTSTVTYNCSTGAVIVPTSAPNGFNPGDGRIDPHPGDRIAVYCVTETRSIMVYGVDSNSKGIYLAKFSYNSLVAAGKDGITKKVTLYGTISASVDSQSNFWVAWNGGVFNATGQGDFAKGFNCDYTGVASRHGS